MTKFLFLILTAFTSLASASSWHEFIVHQGHGSYDKSRPFKARISYTVEQVTPTIGLEMGGLETGKLFIEIYTLQYPGRCPDVQISQFNKSGDQQLIYPLALTFDVVEGKCWAEISDRATSGYWSPGGGKTNYGASSLGLKFGNQKVRHRLYVRGSNFYNEYNFVLGDSL